MASQINSTLPISGEPMTASARELRDRGRGDFGTAGGDDTTGAAALWITAAGLVTIADGVSKCSSTSPPARSR